MTRSSPSSPALDQALALPCGSVLKNRIVKAAMSDSLGDGKGDPTEAQRRLYERWATGGAALSIIGEVQVGPDFPERPGNLVLSNHADQQAMRALTRRAKANGAQIWPQLGHAGALAHPPISRPKGPSTLDLEGLQCEAMSLDEIGALPGQFADAACLARSVGFDGVEIHAAHGFLLSQFLSPLFNRRQDGYGGDIEARSRLLLEIIDHISKAVGPAFPIGVKINASDQLEGGLSEEEALHIIGRLEQSSIDLIDISGGTYFPGAKPASESAGHGPYFSDFAARARPRTGIPLMLTGGIKTRAQALDVLASGAADAIGLARALVLNPDLPETWLGDRPNDPEFPRFETAPPGGITAWYSMRLTALGEDREQRFPHDLEAAIREYEDRDAWRSVLWKKAFDQR